MIFILFIYCLVHKPSAITVYVNYECFPSHTVQIFFASAAEKINNVKDETVELSLGSLCHGESTVISALNQCQKNDRSTLCRS